MNNIDFSIIIPHYNIPESLIELLETVPDKENIEIIVVDDKSDRDLSSLEDYTGKTSASYIFLHNDTPEKGAGVCRNIGMKAARGKWLLFADSDDLFADDMYEHITRCADRKEDVIFFLPTSKYKDTGKIASRHEEFCDSLRRYLKEPCEENELILRYHMVAPWSKMIRRSLIEDNHISFENTMVANDVFFCRQLGVYADSVAVEDATIYIITDREGSLTKMIGKEAYLVRADVFVRSARFVRQNVDKTTWKKIDMNGRYILSMCIHNKVGATAFFHVCINMIANGIRLL